jgi:hypothetical protein
MGNGKHATIPYPFANAIPRMAKGMTTAGEERHRRRVSFLRGFAAEGLFPSVFFNFEKQVMLWFARL